MAEHQALNAWDDVIARLRSLAPKADQGPSILGIRILCDTDGQPVLWTKPTVTVLEPKGCDVTGVLADLTTCGMM